MSIRLGEGWGEGLRASALTFFLIWDNLEPRALETFHVRVDIEESDLSVVDEMFS